MSEPAREISSRRKGTWPYLNDEACIEQLALHGYTCQRESSSKAFVLRAGDGTSHYAETTYDLQRLLAFVENGLPVPSRLRTERQKIQMLLAMLCLSVPVVLILLAALGISRPHSLTWILAGVAAVAGIEAIRRAR